MAQHSKAPKPSQRNRRVAQRRPAQPSKTRMPETNAPRPRSTWMGVALGVLVGVGAVGSLSWSSGCKSETTAGTTASAEPSSSAPFAVASAAPTVTEDSSAPVVAEPDPPKAPPEPKEKEPWQGPWLGALAQQTPIYPTARFSRNRLGYLRRGAKVAVQDKPIKTRKCRQGFYPLVDGGYVCGKYATLNTEDPRVRMGVKPPDIEAALPYRYAYNRAHGTPLYLSVPSRDDMHQYEPYLLEKKKKKKKKKSRAQRLRDEEKDAAQADKPRPSRSKATAASASAASSSKPPSQSKPLAKSSASAASSAAAAPTPSASAAKATSSAAPQPSASGASGGGGAPAKPVPWWRRKKGERVDVKLSDLNESDGTLAKRMVKGFFIAVDRTFAWNQRMWYKTTEGLLAPSDRMIIPKTPSLKGKAWPEGAKQLGFIRSHRAYKYEHKKDSKRSFKRKGRIKRFSSFVLTGETKLYRKRRYRKTADGWWFRGIDGTYTDSKPRPERVGEDEKWVDVNITRKTLVAFKGDTPVFAALVSPGKKSSNPKKDHRTKTGIWRIREKHITTTMDGDGSNAGELPYSIMDVPYVQYYDGSYALHTAFWHNNFGREQSHGCVNLSPHDAKWLFRWTDPQLPEGWHGVWSSNKRRGSWVVVHE
jgi:hypothetical protein